ncbi:RNA-binding S4 domain-containing protein [Salmonella enterica subsp. enterica]|nr:RNA-binding S4 domain-containing protein [Salmonella enterica subsp. enterica]
MHYSLGKHPHRRERSARAEALSESGAQAKIAIADGLVKADGTVGTRVAKIVAGKTVSFEGQSVNVVA